MPKLLSDKPAEHEETGVTQTRMRSPNFPLIGLRKAVKRLDEMHGKYKRMLVPVGLVHALWGYKANSGIGNQVVAALKSFGLIDVEGEATARKVQVSEDGYRIALQHRERGELLQKAALKPPIYAELWNKYKDGDFPNADIIKHYLLFDRAEVKFNPDVVDGFIEEFLDTLTFFGNISGDIIPPADEAEESSLGRTLRRLSEREKQKDSPPTNHKRRLQMPTGTIEVNYPVDAGMVYIAWPENIGPDEIEEVESWVQMMLKRMKRSADAQLNDLAVRQAMENAGRDDDAES
jgi:hypothetical protein